MSGAPYYQLERITTPQWGHQHQHALSIQYGAGAGAELLHLSGRVVAFQVSPRTTKGLNTTSQSDLGYQLKTATFHAYVKQVMSDGRLPVLELLLMSRSEPGRHDGGMVAVQGCPGYEDFKIWTDTAYQVCLDAPQGCHLPAGPAARVNISSACAERPQNLVVEIRDGSPSAAAHPHTFHRLARALPTVPS